MKCNSLISILYIVSTTLLFGCGPVNTKDSIVIKGTVIDAVKKDPLSGVLIEILNFQSYTDSLGKYIIHIDKNEIINDSLVNYDLKFSKDSFFSDGEELILDTINTQNNLDISTWLQSTRVPLIMDGVEFELTKSKIRHESHLVLDSYMRLFEWNPDLSVEIGVHQDYRGSVAYSDCISCNRAISVAEYFISKGIDENRIKSKGYKDRKPRIVPKKGKSTTSITQWNKEWGRKYQPGDTLTIDYINKAYRVATEGWENAMQKNRRVEMRVIENN